VGEAGRGGGGAAVGASDFGRILDAVRGVRWPARRSVVAGVPGAHRSRRRGTAVEFTEYRPYRQGDDPRRLDWKLLARTDRAYVRLTDDHAVLPTTIIVDASASMAYPVVTRAKWWLAAQMTIGLAAVAHAAGDPVGVTVVSGDNVVADIARTTRRRVVTTIAESLSAVVPGAGGGRPLALDRTAPRGRWVMVSDFLQDDGAGLARARAVAAAGGEAYAIHIVAREEMDPARQALLVSDPEVPALRRPLLPETRRAYLDAFGAWREVLRESWQAAGAWYAIVETDEPAERAVRRIVRW
jgi:uncharacterized protein (DUF58 family)